MGRCKMSNKLVEKKHIDVIFATVDYNDVSLFVQVVQLGSFTAVAEKLGVQKSSVSRGVARLEESLGVRLLHRSTRRLATTDAGQAFFERVRRAVADVDDAANAAKEDGSEPRGTVRLTGPPDSQSLGLPEIVAQFLTRYPKIQVELILTARNVDLISEGVDLAIRAGKLVDSSLVARRIGAASMALFGAPSYLGRRGRPEKLADLRHHGCVLFRGRGGRATWTMSGPNGDESIEVSSRVSADEMEFVGRLAAAGAGIALLPVALAREFVRRDELELVLGGYTFEGGGVHVVLPTSVHVPSRVALLRDFLVEHLTARLAEARRECAGARTRNTAPATKAFRRRVGSKASGAPERH